MSAKLKFDNYGSSVSGSRDCGLSSKPVLKDSRPLSDKQFQNAAVQKGRFEVLNKKGFENSMHSLLNIVNHVKCAKIIPWPV